MLAQRLRRWPNNKLILPQPPVSAGGNRQNMASQQKQNICITFIQCWTNVFDVDPTLYKCYTNVLFLLAYIVRWDDIKHPGLLLFDLRVNILARQWLIVEQTIFFFISLTWQENNYVHTAPDVLAGLCLQCHTCEESGCLGEQDQIRTMISVIQEQFLFTLFSLPHFLLNNIIVTFLYLVFYRLRHQLLK